MSGSELISSYLAREIMADSDPVSVPNKVANEWFIAIYGIITDKLSAHYLCARSVYQCEYYWLSFVSVWVLVAFKLWAITLRVYLLIPCPFYFDYLGNNEFTRLIGRNHIRFARKTCAIITFSPLTS